jgi:hypothetical protein
VGFTCRQCGQWHAELPLSYHVQAPAMWSRELESDPDTALEQETCVIAGRYFFVRGLIRLPVVDSSESFDWGIWVSLSETNYVRMRAMWETAGREATPAMFAWLSTDLPVYAPSTLNLKTMVHTQPIGLRPQVELEPTDHPLAVEQREGITMSRVQEFAERLLHDP